MPAKHPTPETILVPRTLVTQCRVLLSALAAGDAMAQRSAADAIREVLAAINPHIPTEADEMLATLQITETSRRASGGGTWVTGNIAGHRFGALVFPEHAESESYELGQSRISKLWLQEHITHEEVAFFERGWDKEPTTDAAQRIVDLLAAGLAETVFGK